MRSAMCSEKKFVRRICYLLHKSLLNNSTGYYIIKYGNDGFGKHERFVGDFSGYWSRRIKRKN